MRGDRFKTRLPNFIGKISDMNDLFIAEDREFEKIDYLLMDFINALFVEGIKNIENPEYFLRRLEKEYGIDSLGNVDERIAKIITKMRGKRTTTESVILEICRLFGFEATFEENYKHYSFIIGTKNFRLSNAAIKAIGEIKPAHLGIILKILFEQKIYYGMYAQKAKKHTIFPARPQDKNINLNVYFGGAVARKKVIRKLRGINVFIGENNKRYEVTGPGGEILDYER